MKQYRTTPITIEAGCIIVDPDNRGLKTGSALIRAKSTNSALLEVDLASKYADTGGFLSGGRDMVPGVFLTFAADTIGCDRTKNDTLVLFDKFPGYKVFAASIFGYTLCIALIKGD